MSLSLVALSSDGRRLGIGAIANDVTGSWSGHTRIYDCDGCVNGGIIYNTATNMFNFCEDGIWVEK